MGKTIDPARVRELAERRGIRSAKRLANKLGVSERTAYRIWAGDIAPRFRAVKLEKLAEVLGVDVAVLTGEAPMPVGQSDDKPEDALARLGHMRLKTVVRTAAANALALNAVRYRVTIKAQLELAALLFHVVAQRSLRHRREALTDLYDDLDRLNALGKARAPHMPSPGPPRAGFDEGLTAETRSIEAEDIFAEAEEFSLLDSIGEDRVRQNPFAEEIRRLAKGLPDIDEQQIDVTVHGFNYTINRPQAMALADGDEELAEAILDGSIKLQGLTWKLVGEDRTQERVAELRRRQDEHWAEVRRRVGVSPELEPF